MEKDETELLKPIMEEIANEKRLHLARNVIYPHITKAIDTVLELKGVTLAEADKQKVNRNDLWDWVVQQLKI